MSHRSRLLSRKIPRREREAHVVIDSPSSITKPSTTAPLLSDYDYQAPSTYHSISPRSKWIIVRNNIHRIRCMGDLRRVSGVDKPIRDWYLFFQMRRELKRAEDQIRAIQYRTDFTPVRHFKLPIDATHTRRYNVSHVRPNDGIYYAGLGTEPIVLQYLLYYFSKECKVPYDSIFYSFLSDVNAVLAANRQRMNRVVVYRKVALIITLIIFSIIIIMFFSLILSVLTTTSNLRQMYKNVHDEDMKWRSSKTFQSIYKT
ncbi:unnamed protein product [Rotaria sp. Silwood1]|nr:unnamed protein product [Rotaria sp. Silwood1]CAF3512388.1 unnamed protein product [Rotaria sp. Silwood1]CAF3606205.1 unnamed protein product [Rotaria sp. Silwood1]CAF4829926.1 unnamed protein product [Rotaria sp. Silwood1]CAF5025571.1 unnamed protein product [Rotaria sp. Silwood1]